MDILTFVYKLKLELFGFTTFYLLFYNFITQQIYKSEQRSKQNNFVEYDTQGNRRLYHSRNEQTIPPRNCIIFASLTILSFTVHITWNTHLFQTVSSSGSSCTAHAEIPSS